MYILYLKNMNGSYKFGSYIFVGQFSLKKIFNTLFSYVIFLIVN